ncbi:MAG: Na+:solute symporter, partial [Actinopolymorphaceae bacterium]
RRCGPSAAILSWAAGLVTFVVTRYVIDAWVASLAPDLVTAVQVGGPVVVALVVYVLIGLVRPWHDVRAAALVDALSTDADDAGTTELADARAG